VSFQLGGDGEYLAANGKRRFTRQMKKI